MQDRYPPTIDYAPPHSARRRLLARIRKWIPITLILATVVLSIIFGPTACRHRQLLQLQEACMTAALPDDRPLLEYRGEEAQRLLSLWPTEYRRDTLGWAIRRDLRWDALATRLGVPDPLMPGIPSETIFLHERESPNGNRRLVIVEGQSVIATVIIPAGLMSEATVNSRVASLDSETAQIIGDFNDLGPFSFSPGIIDPGNRSRFTIPVNSGRANGLLDCQLEDDDTVTIKMRDPLGFWRQVRSPGGA